MAERVPWAIEQRSRPIVLDPPRRRAAWVPLNCTLFKMQLLNNRLRSNTILPPLCRACRPTPHRHSTGNKDFSKKRKPWSWRRSRVVSWNSLCILSKTTHPGEAPRSAPATAVLDWRHGVGRQRRTVDAHPSNGAGGPRRVNRTRHDSPRRTPGYRTRPIPALASPSDKAGAGRQRTPSRKRARGGSQGRARGKADRGGWNGAKQRVRFALLVRCTALLIVAVASARKGRSALLTRRDRLRSACWPLGNRDFLIGAEITSMAVRYLPSIRTAFLPTSAARCRTEPTRAIIFAARRPRLRSACRSKRSARRESPWNSRSQSRCRMTRIGTLLLAACRAPRRCSHRTRASSR
jgi:hypothetical protein